MYLVIQPKDFPVGVGNAGHPCRPPWVAIEASKSALKTHRKSS